MDLILEASIDRFQYSRGTRSAIHGIDLKVREGEFVVIAGPAGAGKTTLCYCLAGVIPHFISGDYRGLVKVKDRSLTELRLPEIAGLVGFVLQRPENQLFNLTVEEDVAFGPENLGMSAGDIRDRLGRSLDFVGMSDFGRRMCSALSGGETQRVVLSCILAMDPDLFVLDQPAAELDPLGRKQIYENICRLNRDEGKTIILVEDRLSDVLPYASRMLLLSEGQIVRDAPPEEFYSDERVLSYGIRVPDAVRLHHSLKNSRLAPQGICLAPQDLAGHFKPLLHLPNAAGMFERDSESSNGAGGNGAPYAIQVRELSFRYPASDRWALENINLDFKHGELTAIIGSNGAGKTTLAKHFIGLLRPTQGQVIVKGEDISRTPTSRVSDTVGYLFQDPDFQIFCNSVFDEVAFTLKIRKASPAQIETLVNETLRKLGLFELKERHPYLLSRGQRQRLALASILVHGPEVLVIDEPSTGLDYRETIEVMGLLAEFRDRGGTVIMITHDMEMVMRYAQRSLVMTGGKVVVDTATPDIGKYSDVLTQAGIQLPELYHLVHALGLPPTCRDVEGVMRLIIESCR